MSDNLQRLEHFAKQRLNDKWKNRVCSMPNAFFDTAAVADALGITPTQVSVLVREDGFLIKQCLHDGNALFSFHDLTCLRAALSRARKRGVQTLTRSLYP